MIHCFAFITVILSFFQSEYHIFVEEFKKNQGIIWIMKPAAKSQGRGIFLFRKLKDITDWKKVCVIPPFPLLPLRSQLNKKTKLNWPFSKVIVCFIGIFHRVCMYRKEREKDVVYSQVLSSLILWRKIADLRCSIKLCVFHRDIVESLSRSCDYYWFFF